MDSTRNAIKGILEDRGIGPDERLERIPGNLPHTVLRLVEGSNEIDDTILRLGLVVKDEIARNRRVAINFLSILGLLKR
jgi:hypothetical protein